MSDRMLNRIAIGGLAALMVAAVVLIVLAALSPDTWADQCRAKGNHITSSSHNVTTINPTNGQPSIGTVTTRFCLSPSGGIVSVD